MILISLSVSGQTSVYHPLPDSNAVWNMYLYQMCFIPWGITEQHYSITMVGDTLINGLNYHKLATPHVQTITSGECPGVSKGLKGAYRQDVTLRKVFYIPTGDSVEQLLYDFNLQVGDTVRGYTERMAIFPDIVESIDSVLVGSNYHKRWYINPCFGIYLIEGIGSTYGIFEASPGCISDGPEFNLTCFQQDGMTQYPDTTTDCQLLVDVDTPPGITDQINVFPNPSNGSFTVDLDQPENFRELHLTGMAGNNILREPVAGRSRIRINDLPAGVYLLTLIRNDNTTVNRKMISIK